MERGLDTLPLGAGAVSFHEPMRSAPCHTIESMHNLISIENG